MTAYRLYGRAGTGSFAPELLLIQMKQPYELVPVSREAARSDDYRKLCPTAMVPALTLPNGETIFESAAICIHLTLAHPGAGLAPTPGSAAHAHFLQWMAFLSGTLYGAYRRVNYADRFTTAGAADAEKVRAKGLADAVEAYRLLEAALDGAGPGLLGPLGAADCYLFMLMTWHEPNEAVLHRDFPTLARLASAVRKRPELGDLIAENAS